jgi:hypothetical protein
MDTNKRAVVLDPNSIRRTIQLRWRQLLMGIALCSSLFTGTPRASAQSQTQPTPYVMGCALQYYQWAAGMQFTDDQEWQLIGAMLGAWQQQDAATMEEVSSHTSFCTMQATQSSAYMASQQPLANESLMGDPEVATSSVALMARTFVYASWKAPAPSGSASSGSASSGSSSSGSSSRGSTWTDANGVTLGPGENFQDVLNNECRESGRRDC